MIEHTDARAERAILSHAEAYRLVEEARQMRAERDAALARAERAEGQRDRLVEALRPFAHHSLGGWDARSERQYRIRVTEGQVARAGILLGQLADASREMS